jgi:hypothetical protein
MQTQGLSTTDGPLDDVGLLVFLAGQLAAGQGATEDTARRRGWLSEQGQITEAGRAILTALKEQARTRSVFRPLCA